MNFGFRLPGPFRVGISSKGRISAGVNLGPFSMSGGIGGSRGGQKTQQGVFYPVTLDQFVAQAQAEGFSVQVTPGYSATIERRWMAGTVTVVPGRGVMLKRVWSTWQILSLIGVILLVIGLCCGPAFFDMANSRNS
jgi:hypothetical protein